MEAVRVVTPNHNCWAIVVMIGTHFIIQDGTNCGVRTAACTFPGLKEVKTYLSGRWNVPWRELEVVSL